MLHILNVIVWKFNLLSLCPGNTGTVEGQCMHGNKLQLKKMLLWSFNYKVNHCILEFDETFMYNLEEDFF